MSDPVKQYRYLAFDFGAESGRALLGTVTSDGIHLEEIHRFPTQGITMLGTRQWDVTRIYGEMLASLTKYVQKHGSELNGIAVDTWGVDFGLLSKDGSLVGNPIHYRDHRHAEAMELAITRVGRDEIYRHTGIQFLPFNTIYQLLAVVEAKSPVLEIAETMLLMGDLFGYLLSGIKACEYTNASTTQLLDAKRRTWSRELVDALKLPSHLLLEPVSPGTILGPILEEVASATGLDARVPVIAPATHDTASAVAAVPVAAGTRDWAYLSSGTWSLLGAEIDHPLINADSQALNFTNEGGVAGRIRFLKNIIGLWLVQECRRCWERDGKAIDYAEMTRQAGEAEAFAALIDVDDLRLMAPKDMPALIQAIAVENGYSKPESCGAIVRCCLESLALKYRKTLNELDTLLGRRTQKLHVIGGGTQNRLLCQMTADSCGIPVIAGPVEATALGNIAVQAMATGVYASLEAARAAIAKSAATILYEPQNHDRWNEAAEKFAAAGVNG